MLLSHNLRAVAKLSELGAQLMTLHDDLADLKSYFDGHGEPTEAQLAGDCSAYVV